MSSKSTVRILATLVFLAMLAAACGQKDGVHVGFAGGAVGTGVAASEGVPAFTDADGDGIDDNTNLSQDEFAQAASSGSFGGGGTGVASSGGGGGTAAPGTTTTSSGGGGGTPSGQASGGDGGGDGGGDRGGDKEQPPPSSTGPSQGVTDSTITIGIHAPLTGAAPIPAESFKSGKDQYWKNNKVAGRQVKVEFRDDKYNPSAASQVCQELVSSVKVFLLIGSGGTDQIAECARIAAASGVPYVSAGVTEINLSQMATYFSLSKSYGQQMPLLMQIIKKEAKPSNGKVGLIASNTANFDDAVSAYESAAGKAGFTPVVYRPNKKPSDAELAALASRMASDGITVATPVMAPTDWIKLAANVHGQVQTRNMKWRGIGITMGLNTVASAACKATTNAVDTSTFFSPWPGLNLAPQMDPKFPNGDDIQWSLWGLNKTLDTAFSKMGNNLTHQAFSQAMTSGIKSGIYPNLFHTQSNHFGADSVHVLRLSCADGQFKSTSADIFKKSF